MNPFVYQGSELPAAAGESFWDRVATVPGAIESRLPTLDKSLDAYFDRRFAAIIEEWELVTESDLNRLENRLTRVTGEISGLYAEKMALESRARDLDALIASLEGSK
jgi:hypothetical protein